MVGLLGVGSGAAVVAVGCLGKVVSNVAGSVPRGHAGSVGCCCGSRSTSKACGNWCREFKAGVYEFVVLS